MKKYTVEKNGHPCRLTEFGLHKLGVLRTCNPLFWEADVFEGDNGLGKRKAGYAIKRTKRVADKLRKSVVSEWDEIADLVSPGEYVIKEME